MRSIKQPPELAAIQQAIDVTIDGIKFITDKTRLGNYEFEYQMEADLTHRFRQSDHGHCFDPIVAAGVRACQLHNTENTGRIAVPDYIVIDVGAEAGLYAADIARTVIVGQPTKRQRAVYEAVCQVQDYALTLLGPGVINIEYEQQVETFMGDRLRALGLIKKVDKQSVRKYFPHMTSHFLGLEAHDVGVYDQPMEPGMVMVCEPGIIFPKKVSASE